METLKFKFFIEAMHIICINAAFSLQTIMFLWHTGFRVSNQCTDI